MRKFLILSIFFVGLISYTACKNTSGEKAQLTEVQEVNDQKGIDYTVDIANSTINWEGSKPTGTHTGTLNLTEGTVVLEGKKVVGGSFTLDMNSINVTDLEGDDKAYLETHLKGTGEKGKDDFFNVNQYPTAIFEITKVTNLDGDNMANTMVYGNLTMRNITKGVGFKAKIEVGDGSVSVTTPQFTIDRTQWGIKYNSPSFFEGLKEKAISNEIGLKIDLSASSPAM